MARLPRPRIPKIKEHAVITLGDSTILKGHVSIEATMRIQDLLNDPHPFFPFIDEDEKIHLISKAWVMRVQPHD